MKATNDDDNMIVVTLGSMVLGFIIVSYTMLWFYAINPPPSGYFYVTSSNSQYACHIGNRDITEPLSLDKAKEICDNLNKDLEGHANLKN